LTEPSIANPENPLVQTAHPSGSADGNERPSPSLWAKFCRWAALFWLDVLFGFSLYWPWFANLVKRSCVWGTWHCSKAIRKVTRTNARRILGPKVSDQEIDSVAFATTRSFYEFVSELGRSLGMTHKQLLDQIDSVEGQENYLGRRQDSGAILLTAHLGSFEIGVAGLLQFEEHVHVLYHPDQSGLFERMRSKQRKHLGVIEERVDSGLGTWLKLRDALRENHVVLVQGDRVLPGQKGVLMPFCHGHIEMPTGPVKLALASGSPIIPVFAVRVPSGKVKIFLDEAIEVPQGSHRIDATHPTMIQIAQVIEKYVKQFPEQWHFFQPIFHEDQINATEKWSPQ
jgi:lauroyl/myristoyl acyltransferase